MRKSLTTQQIDWIIQTLFQKINAKNHYFSLFNHLLYLSEDRKTVSHRGHREHGEEQETGTVGSSIHNSPSPPPGAGLREGSLRLSLRGTLTYRLEKKWIPAGVYPREDGAGMTPGSGAMLR